MISLTPESIRRYWTASLANKIFIPLLIWLMPCELLAQEVTVQGVVYEALIQAPVPEAQIFVDGYYVTMTNAYGGFTISDMPPGRHRLRIEATGYLTYLETEWWIEAGKSKFFQFYISPLSITGDTIYIKDYRLDQLMSRNTEITVEQIDRFPASFNDPARLINTLPGVSTANDQANHAIIRGHSPNDMSWYLEGMEIVNPNHLTNAGTPSDKPSLNGGGVNMISAQLLDRANFYAGGLPTSLGNALSGGIDLQLRPGNLERHQYTIQAGLLGLDLAAEGPVVRDRVSFLANYRYSTLGLLSALGINFGDEVISFQDASLHTYVQLPRGHLKIFGMWGNSTNLFDGTDKDTIETFKDLYRIDYTNTVGIGGFQWQQLIGNRSLLRMGLTYSVVDARRDANQVQGDIFSINFAKDALQQSKLSLISEWSWQASEVHSLKIGIQSNQQNFQGFALNADLTDASIWMISPYANYQFQKDKWELQAGLRTPLISDQDIRPEPRIEVAYRPGSHHQIGASLQRQTQLHNPVVYLFHTQHPAPADSWHYEISYQYSWKQDRYLQVNAYHQSLDHLLTLAGTPGEQSSLNWFEDIPYGTYLASSQANINGIELAIQQFLQKNWYYLVNASIFETKYRNAAGNYVPGRFDQGYVAHATVGKEWKWEGKKKNHNVGVNLHLQQSGGLREPDIDLVNSRAFHRTVYDFSQGYRNQLGSYFKTDLRVYWRRNTARISSLLSLDIQNLTNAQNEAFHYYDFYFDRIDLQYQLGLIPIISYKLFW